MHCDGAIAFAEGVMEREFVRRSFRKLTTIPVGNGATISLSSLRDDIVSKLRIRQSKPSHVFVVIDRERRLETACQIESFLRGSICAEGFDAGEVSILISDRMIENVILADESFIRATFGNESYLYPDHEFSGKSVLREMYKQIGINYKETVQGVDALNRIKLKNAAGICPGVLSFLNSLPTGCYLKSSAGS